ncbi:MAG TPA: AbrB/MazE/SpoVT family DNA-binding domain-containing protein [Dehalococcoidia bacterium]|nr:AbrB/MazE/SpoVT family DNA-binding domain-containing protein [Dehalococcoidia bacterium]
MVSTRVGKRGTLVIPATFRHALGLEEGTTVTAEEFDGGVLIRPVIGDDFSEEERAALIAEAIKSYATLREDPRAWTEYQEEQAAWERLGIETWPKEVYPIDEDASHE